MGFDVKKILGLSSNENRRKSHPPEANSPNVEDIHTPSSQGSTYNQSLDHAITRNSKQTNARDRHHLTSNMVHVKGIRYKASRMLRLKESREPGGFLNELSSATTSNVEIQLDQLFDKLRDHAEDSKDSLGVESTMNYLTSLGLNPESGEIFVALELVQAPNFGEITRKGFVDGWKGTGVAPTTADHAKYISKLVRQFSNDPSYFKRVYRYTFVAGKEADQRSMNLENAMEFWRVLFSPPGRPWLSRSHNWLELWVSYLQEKWTRSVNRDMWNQTLEFAIRSMEDETLSFWSEDGAWPSVIDDFVAWCRTQGIGAKDAMQTDS